MIVCGSMNQFIFASNIDSHNCFSVISSFAKLKATLILTTDSVNVPITSVLSNSSLLQLIRLTDY